MSWPTSALHLLLKFLSGELSQVPFCMWNGLGSHGKPPACRVSFQNLSLWDSDSHQRLGTVVVVEVFDPLPFIPWLAVSKTCDKVSKGLSSKAMSSGIVRPLRGASATEIWSTVVKIDWGRGENNPSHNFSLSFHISLFSPDTSIWNLEDIFFLFRLTCLTCFFLHQNTHPLTFATKVGLGVQMMYLPKIRKIYNVLFVKGSIRTWWSW